MEMRKSKVSPKRFVVLGLIILGFFLLMDLFNRIAELARLSKERDNIYVEVMQLTSTSEILVTQIAYATSIPAVEDWAREQGRMALPDDILVIPINPGETTPEARNQSFTLGQEVSSWEIWWALLFGD